MPEQPGLFDVIYTTRAMRRLKPDPVPEELLLKLVDAGNQAPTGSNMQNVRWLIVRDAEQKQKLADLNRTAINAYIAQGPVPELPPEDMAKMERTRDAVFWQRDHMHETPAIIIACGEFPMAIENPLLGAGQVWPAVQNLLLAARGMGLGATPTTLGLTPRDASRAILGLPDNVEAYVLVPVGYPEGRFGPVKRLAVDQTVHWDRWA